VNEEWQKRALCREIGVDLFFPEEKGDTAGQRQARKVCRLCDVQAECLAFALATDEAYGIWGGKNPEQRMRLQRRAA
jgi:WhiB family redox-sensing transcriptional regulator